MRATTGIPPPPQATAIVPASSRRRIASSSTIPTGAGEGTTRRQPRPASSASRQPRSDCEPLRLLAGIERPDRLGRLGEGRVVRVDAHVGDDARDRPRGHRAELEADRGRRSPPASARRRARAERGASSAARSERSRPDPDLGPVAVGEDERLVEQRAERLEVLAQVARCSAAVPRSPSRTSALPPSATTVVTRARLLEQPLLGEHVRERAFAHLLKADVTRSAGRSKSTSRRRSIGVPIRTRSAFDADDRLAQVVHLPVAVAHRRQQRATCGYSSNVLAIEPTAKGRGSTSSAAPCCFAASAAAP